MNKEGHLISSLIILNIIAFTWLGFIYYQTADRAAQTLMAAIFLSIVFFVIGCIAPDFDHHAVQKGPLWILKGKTSHRGHWHSIIANLIYCGIIFLITYWIMILWYYPVIFGGIGFFSHLAEDEGKNFWNQMKGKQRGSRAIKLW